MDIKLLVALAGVIVSALSTELNEAVSGMLLNDIGGGLGFGHDPGTWFSSLYSTGEVFGMAISPWFAVTFSMRRWALFVIGLTVASTLAANTSSASAQAAKSCSPPSRAASRISPGASAACGSNSGSPSITSTGARRRRSRRHTPSAPAAPSGSATAPTSVPTMRQSRLPASQPGSATSCRSPSSQIVSNPPNPTNAAASSGSTARQTTGRRPITSAASR